MLHKTTHADYRDFHFHVGIILFIVLGSALAGCLGSPDNESGLQPVRFSPFAATGHLFPGSNDDQRQAVKIQFSGTTLNHMTGNGKEGSYLRFDIHKPNSTHIISYDPAKQEPVAIIRTNGQEGHSVHYQYGIPNFNQWGFLLGEKLTEHDPGDDKLTLNLWGMETIADYRTEGEVHVIIPTENSLEQEYVFNQVYRFVFGPDPIPTRISYWLEERDDPELKTEEEQVWSLENFTFTDDSWRRPETESGPVEIPGLAFGPWDHYPKTDNHEAFRLSLDDAIDAAEQFDETTQEWLGENPEWYLHHAEYRSLRSVDASTGLGVAWEMKLHSPESTLELLVEDPAHINNRDLPTNPGTPFFINAEARQEQNVYSGNPGNLTTLDSVFEECQQWYDTDFRFEYRDEGTAQMHTLVGGEPLISGISIACGGLSIEAHSGRILGWVDFNSRPAGLDD